ncbi:MAG: ABC transporter substrate-binding protein [Phycisphaeraceae bacterium]|nr:MAG: ABC transporter substrate-binding protein [Phycisphaeraceae bacterium]
MRPHRALNTLAGIAGVAILLTLAGCGKSPSASSAPAGSEGAAGGGDTHAPLVVGFSQIGAESDWRRANTDSIQSEAKKRGIDLRFSDAQQKKENQIKAIRSFIAQGVDVISFSPVVETGFEQVLEEAKKAGIPVVLSDRAVDVSDPTLYKCFIGSDFVEEGRRAAQWFIDHTEGDVKVAELVGTPGSAPALDRAEGFREAIKDVPRIQIVWSQSGNFTRTEGKKAFQAFLKSPEAKGVGALYAHNDDMAIGAIQAIKEAGLKPGVDIKIVSIDAVKEAFKAMIAGELNCTVECNPLIGPQLFDLIEKVARGEEIPHRVKVDEEVFTQDVAADLIDSRQY